MILQAPVTGAYSEVLRAYSLGQLVEASVSDTLRLSANRGDPSAVGPA